MAVLFALGLSLQPAWAQWIAQPITLNPGWNAVYLPVHPASPACDELFKNLPLVESVWKFNRRFTTAEFVESPAALIAQSDHWLIWLPPGNPDSFLRNLQQLEGGQAYLIKVPAGAAPFVWNVTGRPALPATELIPNALNLVGLPVRDDPAPTFSEFFQSTPEVPAAPGAGSGIFSLGPDGHELQIRQTARVQTAPATAYWVKLSSFVRSLIPLEITGAFQATGSLDFDRNLKELSFTLRNASLSNTLSLVLTPRASAPAPAGQAVVAGVVPLSFFHSNLGDNEFGWVDFTSALTFTLAPGEQREVRIAVRRSALAPFPGGGAAGAAYQSLLEVVELQHGFRVWLPVVAESETVRRRLNGAKGIDDLPLYDANQGLWVGQATIQKVSRTASGTNVTWDPAVPQPVAHPLSYRVLLHINASGNAQLLQKVVLTSDPANTNQPTRLYRDERLVPAGAAILSRISSTAFPIMAPVALAGQFENALMGTIRLDYDDPVNPFKHAFHPDHNNLGEDYAQKLPAGLESLTVTRDVLFDFAVTHQSDDGRYLPPGPVLDFSGTNQFVTLDGLMFGSNCTFMAWVRVENPQRGDMTLFESGNGPLNDTVSLGFDGASGRMSFHVAAGGVDSQITSTNAFPSNTWVHVTATSDGLGSGRLYWNGALQAEGDLLPPATVLRTNNYAGQRGAAPHQYLRGRMYDLVIWDDVRTATEISEDMHLSYGADDDFMTAYFKANEGQGTTLGDVSGNHHQAALNGAQWDRSEMAPVPFWGIGECEGRYRETISGLRPQPLVLEGTFKLERINRDAVIY